MSEEHRPDFEEAPLRVRLIETDDGEVARYLAGLREKVARRLEPLGE
ncbi:hypothetical protein [Rubellimicrobium rubrum]|nr:hypothetical protein [Rubellimicrobium rubrum]